MRKHATVKNHEAEAVREAQSFIEVRYQIAKDAYDAQDAETQALLDRMVAVLRLHATVYVDVTANPPHGGTVPVKMEARYIDQNLLYIAVETLKTLAIFDVRVANFKFPESLCVSCGTPILGLNRPRKRAR